MKRLANGFTLMNMVTESRSKEVFGRVMDTWQTSCSTLSLVGYPVTHRRGL